MLRRVRRGAAYSAYGRGCGGAKHFACGAAQRADHLVGPCCSRKTCPQHRREQRQGVEPTHQLAAADKIAARGQDLVKLVADRLVDGVPAILRAWLRRGRFGGHRAPRPLRCLTVTWRSASYASTSERRWVAVRSGSDWMASTTSADPSACSSPRSRSAEILRDSAIARSTSSEGARRPRSI